MSIVPPATGDEYPATAELPPGGRALVRPILGFPPHNRVSTYSTSWVRETSGRNVDHLRLALLADDLAPRSYGWSDGPRPSSTTTHAVHFHTTDQLLAEVGDDDP